MSRVPVRIAVLGDALPEGWARLQPAACPCCVGRAQLPVELARMLRRQRPPGIQIVLSDSAHEAALRRTLGAPPLSDYVEL